MGRMLTLEDFGSSATYQSSEVATASLQEAQKLEAFEQGYKAGWDDANKAHHDESNALSADLEGNLRDLSFTFHEAKAHVLKGLEPLVKELVSRVLPQAAQSSLPGMVGDAMQPLLEGAASAPVLLLCTAETRPLIEGLIPQEPGFPLEIQDDPSLTDGQVFLRFGDREHLTDLSSAVQEVATMVSDFFTLNERKEANG